MYGKHLLLFQTNQNKCTSTANCMGVAGRGEATPPNAFSLYVAMAILHTEEAAPATQIFINCNCTGAGRERKEEGAGLGRQLGIETKCEKCPFGVALQKGVAKWENDTLYFAT